MTVYEGDLIAGDVGGVHRLRDGAWEEMSTWSGGVQARALIVHNGQLFAGGYNGVSRWDGTGWQPIGTIPAEHGYTITSLVVYDEQLIVGGQFSRSGSGAWILRWDGQDWLPLGAGLEGLADANELDIRPLITSLAVLDGELIAAGDFQRSGEDTTCRYVARWDGSQWHAMGDTLDTSCGVFPYDGDLIVYGGHVLANGKVSAVLSRWGPVYPGDLNADGHVDVADLLILVESMGTSAGDPGYDLACDLTGDGTVDLADLLRMIDDWGK